MFLSSVCLWKRTFDFVVCNCSAHFASLHVMTHPLAPSAREGGIVTCPKAQGGGEKFPLRMGGLPRIRGEVDSCNDASILCHVEAIAETSQSRFFSLMASE